MNWSQPLFVRPMQAMKAGLNDRTAYTYAPLPLTPENKTDCVFLSFRCSWNVTIHYLVQLEWPLPHLSSGEGQQDCNKNKRQFVFKFMRAKEMLYFWENSTSWIEGSHSGNSLLGRTVFLGIVVRKKPDVSKKYIASSVEGYAEPGWSRNIGKPQIL